MLRKRYNSDTRVVTYRSVRLWAPWKADASMREILFFLRSRCCSSGSFSKRPSVLILSNSLLLNNLARTHKWNICGVKSRLPCRQNVHARSRYVYIVNLLLENVKKKGAKLVLSIRYSITCFRLLAEQFIRYRVITMHRSINFANCALE